MVMRVGGLATGMDIEAIVDKLMEAERMPLNRMHQERTLLEWKRDGFREINRALLDIDNMLLDMKLTRTYNPKSVSSSQENAVTATASSSTTNGTYEIEVLELAQNEMQVSKQLGNIKPDEELSSDLYGTHKFFTYNEDGSKNEYEFEIKEGDTLNQVLQRISRDNNNVRAFYDNGSNRVVFETTRTGVYNESGNEINFEFSDTDASESFFSFLGLNGPDAIVKNAKNASFKYNNGLEVQSKENNYTINGINLQFHDVTTGNARLSVSTDVEDSFEKIKTFVETYNKAIELMNRSQTERKQYDYKPLLEEQKEEMTESQIEKWEEQAKKGILRGEIVIQSGMFAMRQSWQARVETGGEYTTLSQIGITTSKNYLDGGQLVIDEDKLKQALRDNPDDVYKLFSNNVEGEERGLINRLEDSLNQTKRQIEERAGRDTHTGLENYSLGKRMKDLNDRISDFEKKMFQVEQRYWNQFTQMEKAIARFNDQASYLFSQFGGM